LVITTIVQILLVGGLLSSVALGIVALMLVVSIWLWMILPVIGML